MRKIFFFLILLTIYTVSVEAKFNKDSLLKVSKGKYSDKEKLQALNHLCKQTLNIDTKEALHYAQQYLALAQKNNDKNELTKANNFVGMCYFTMSDCEQATPYYILSLKLAEAQKDSLYAAIVLNNLASCYAMRKDAAQTIRYYEKALTLFMKKKDTLWIANVSNNIGVQYKKAKQFEQAEKMFQLALDCRQHTKDSANIGLAMNALGATIMGKMEAKGLHTEEDLVKALNYYQQALRYQDSTREPLDFALTYGNIGEIYYVQGKYELAEKYVLQALRIEKKHHSLEYMLSSYLRLCNIYEKTSRYKESLENLKLYNVYSDSLFSKDKDERMLNMIKKYETDKKEQEIALLQSQNALKDLHTRQLKCIFGLIFLFLLGIVGFVYFLYWQKQKHNQTLFEKNALISQTLAEKEVLMREIHHRVKNNLQVISSLLNLQSKHIQDELALDAIREGRDRVKSMAMIHQNLYQEQKLTAIEMGEYCQKLAESLFTSYNIHQDKVKLQLDIEAIDIDVDNAIPMGLILNELISNSLKYAFPENKQGILCISLANEGDNLVFEVKDNGVGLPQGWDIKKQKSFGYQMIQAFSKKLKATLEIRSEMGTQVRLLVPYHSLKVT